MPVSTDQLIAEVIIKDFASAVADRVAASTTRMGQAVDGATDKVATSTRVLETQAKQFERLKAAVDPVYSSQQRLAEINLQLNRSVQLGVASQAEASAVSAAWAQRLNSQVIPATANFSGALDLAKRAMAAFGIALGAREIIDFGLNSLKAAGGLSNLAQQLGVSTKALQGYQYAATQVGVSQEDMQSALARLTRSIGEAANGNSKAIDSFNKLGIGILDSAGHIRTTEEVALDLADGLAKIKDPAARAAIEVDLLSKSGQKLDTAFASGSETLRKFQREAQQLGMILTEEEIKKAQEAADKLEALDFKWHKLAQTLASDVAPALTNVLDITDRMITGRASLKEYAATVFALMNPGAALGAYIGSQLNPGDLGPNPGTPSVTVPYSVNANVAMDPGDPRRRASNIITSNPTATDDAKKIQDVIDKLKLQDEQLGKTAEQQALLNHLQQAGVTIDSEAGKQIAALTAAYYDHKKVLDALAAMREKDAAIAADDDKRRIEAMRLSKQRIDEQITQEVKSQQAQQDDIRLLQTQIDLIGASNEQRAVTIARVQALITLHKQEGDALTANEKAYVNNSMQIARMNEVLRKQSDEQTKQADFYKQTWKNAIEGVQTAFSDFFDNIQTEGINSFTKLADSISSIWKKLASQIVGKLSMDAIFGSSGSSGALSGIFGTGSSGSSSGGGLDFMSAFGGVNGATGSGSQPQSGGPMGGGGAAFSGMTTTGGSGGYSWGAAGVSAAANLLPIGAAYASGKSVSNAQLGSGIGGMAGGAIGSIWGPVAGMAGSMIGSVAGGLLGGLFGGDKAPKQKSITSITVDDEGMYSLGSSFSKHDTRIAQSRDIGKNAVGALNDILTTLGASVSASGTNDKLQYYGRTPRYMSVVGGVNNQFGSDAGGAQDAVEDFILRSLKSAASSGRLSGVSATAAMAIGSSVDFEQLQSNVAFAQFYDNLGKAPVTVTEASKAIKAIEAQFKDMTDIATQLGVALGPINQGLIDAKNQYAIGFNKTISDAILAITDPLTLALNNQAELAQTRLNEARDAGADIVQVERLNALEREKIIEQSTNTLRQFYQQITFGNLSGQTAAGSRAGSLAAFQAASAQASAGDPTAQSNLANLGSQFLGYSRSIYASGSGYQSDLQLVQDAVGGLLVGTGGGSLAGVITAGNTEMVRILSANNNEIIDLNETVAGMAEKIALLTSQMQRLLAA